MSETRIMAVFLMAAQSATVTFNRQIAPIIYRHCSS